MTVEREFKYQVFIEEENKLEEMTAFERIDIKMPLMYKFLIFIQILLIILGAGGAIAICVCASIFSDKTLLWGLILCLFVFWIGGNFSDVRFSWIQKYTVEQGMWLNKTLYWDCKTNFAIGYAQAWREAHPFEEKCRLALTKNPNYVADLIRYIKEKDL